MDSSDRRLFIALNPFIHDKILLFRNSLKRELHSSVKWVEDENLHLTLKFLGDTPAYYLNSIKAIIEKSLEGIPAFEIQFTKPGFFGKLSPKVIWFGINESDYLVKLYQEINDRMEQLGFEKEKNGFKPHLTLGRIRNYVESDNLQAKLSQYKSKIPEVKVSEVYLMQSELTPKGPIYSVVADWQLKD
ncbi:MAG: RNA 2',3'-cyclic phosphodiesterase [Bacteroidales bacterium]|nr:RNA 2',3'-cyclic phosphodiesterase [Bacteroidales bacterium]MBN2819148.1 RNA 2',3'-cyclic phosphodiesterase [Bacteroidales bacterium]